MQPTESEGEIFILVTDETYDNPEVDEENWEEASESYRIALEEEFGSDFQEANVGAGADIPAFLTVIATTSVPLWSILLGAFFLGKPISENLDGWADIGRKIKSFFNRPVILARHGAGVLAVGAVFEELGGLPKTVRLLSYRPGHFGDLEKLEGLSRSDDIAENAATVNLGYVCHIFEIEADKQLYRVGVDGKKIKIIRIK